MFWLSLCRGIRWEVDGSIPSPAACVCSNSLTIGEIMITEKDAEIILDIIEAGTDGNWPNVRDRLLERGYQPKEVEDATGRLAKMVGQDNPVCADDF